MSFFTSTKGPEVNNIRVTVENLCTHISNEKYNKGIDPDGVINMIHDFYYYVTGEKNIRIRLPAPMSNTEDHFDMMWPEGAKVSSRPTSVSSSHYKGKRLSSNYKSTKIQSRASSVTSTSKRTVHYVGIAEEESSDERADNDYDDRKYKATSTRHRSNSTRHDNNQKHNGSAGNTLRVNGHVMKPSPSFEEILNKPTYNNMYTSHKKHDVLDYSNFMGFDDGEDDD